MAVVITSVLAFLLFYCILISFCAFGALVQSFFYWMEYERMPNITRGKFFVSLISRILMCSIAVALFFVGIRYILIPWMGADPSWALLSPYTIHCRLGDHAGTAE